MTIEEARKEKGMSRKELSEWLEIPYRTLQNWENGVRPCPAYVEKLVVQKILWDAPNEGVNAGEKMPNEETSEAFAEIDEIKKVGSGQHYSGSTKKYMNMILED